MSFFIFLFFQLISIFISAPSCKDNTNFCSHCNYVTNLCAICQIPEILIPDENGKCIGAKKCFSGKNYCLECDEDGNSCKNCEINYYKDENGGCTYSEGCEISFKGECLKCKENYVLIGKEKEFRFCKSISIDNYKNCKEINYETGFCKTCEEGYNLTSGDYRCIKIENCKESIFGNCILCNQGYYYNKKEDKCIFKPVNFTYCKQSLDGKNCEICNDGYYLDENGICIDSDFCSESEFFKCKKCKKGYYLSNNNICTNTDNCYSANRFTFICENCQREFCLDTIDYKCKSNLDNGPFKFCEKSGKNTCLVCEIGYYLGEDLQCTNTLNCAESENGICTVCSKNYTLGLDNICTNVEKCIYAINGYCTECQDGYYYNKLNNTCLEMKDQFLNCKHTCDLEENKCCECKNNYYLFTNDSLCYENTKDEKFFKCAVVDFQEKCEKCVEGYFLGVEDYKCSKVENCKKVGKENICLECDKYFCLDVKKQECVDNDYLRDITNDKKYISCNRTNKEGTACEKCINGYKLNEDGFCVDIDYCEEEKDGKCTKCKDIQSLNDYQFCANEIFGCLEIAENNCLRCDNLENLYECTECKEGYEKTSSGCIKAE